MSIKSLGIAVLAAGVGLSLEAVTLTHSNYADDAAAGAALVKAVATNADDEITLTAGRWLLSTASGPVSFTRNVMLKGATGNPRDVLIDGGGVTNCVKITGSATGTVIDSLTVTNGYASTVNSTYYNRYGGGIYMTAAATVTNCVVTGCRGDFVGMSLHTDWMSIYGIGIYCSSANALITCTLVENCGGWYAGDLNNTLKLRIQGTGVYKDNGTMSRCLVRNNYNISDAATVSKQLGTSGIGIVSSSGLTDECIIRGNFSTNLATKMAEYESRGAGVALNGGTLKHCLVESNSSCHACGMTMDNASVIECDFIGNVGNKNDARYTVRVDQAQTLSGCRILNNRNLNCGGVGLCKTGAVVSNCVIRGNSGGEYGCAVHLGATNTRATHCFIEAQNNVSYIVGGRGILNTLITDCHFRANTNNTGYCGFFSMDTTWNSTNSSQAPVIRNCLFEKEYWTGGAGRVKVQPTNVDILLLFDSCTFADCNFPNGFLRYASDGISSASGTTAADYGWAGSHFFRRNCLFKDCTGTIVHSNLTFYPNCVSNSYVAANQYVSETTGNLTNENFTVFRDAAKGDYRLKRASELRDKGAYSDWMATAQDMGAGFDVEEGVYTFTACGETHSVGCNLTKKDAYKRRVYGTAPDIGCCEYWAPRGFSMMFR